MIHFMSLFRQTSVWQTTRRQNDQRYLESPSEQPRIRWVTTRPVTRKDKWTTTMCQISKTKCFKQNRSNHERSCWWRKRKLKGYYGKFKSFIPFHVFLNTVHFYTFDCQTLVISIFLKLYFRMQWGHLSLNTWDNVLEQAWDGQFVLRISSIIANIIAQNKIFWNFLFGLWSLPKPASIEIDVSNNYPFYTVWHNNC